MNDNRPLGSGTALGRGRRRRRRGATRSLHSSTSDVVLGYSLLPLLLLLLLLVFFLCFGKIASATATLEHLCDCGVVGVDANANEDEEAAKEQLNGGALLLHVQGFLQYHRKDDLERANHGNARRKIVLASGWNGERLRDLGRLFSVTNLRMSFALTDDAELLERAEKSDDDRLHPDAGVGGEGGGHPILAVVDKIVREQVRRDVDALLL